MPTITCACGKSYRIQDGLGGKSFRCKACNGKLTVPPDGTVAAVRVPAEQLRPFEVDKSLVIGQGTVAGNPGLLRFSVVQYLKTYQNLLWIGVTAGVLTGGMLLFETKSAIIALVAVPFMAIVVPLLAAEKEKAKVRTGNLCAALVIDTNPYTVAVLTDLSNDGRGPRLAVAIRRAPLARMFGGPPRTGDPLVAVSLYFGTLGVGHWDDFMPTVINTACADRPQIARATASIDRADWELLRQVVPKLKSRGLGLYKLWEMPEFR